jgi:hypothetical protein
MLTVALHGRGTCDCTGIRAVAPPALSLDCVLGERPGAAGLWLTCAGAPVPGVQVTVEEVASLKRVGKGSTLLLLDGSGGQSRAVAKALARKGFRRAFVVSGGFKGALGCLPATAGIPEGPSNAPLAPYCIVVRPSLYQTSNNRALWSESLDTVIAGWTNNKLRVKPSSSVSRVEVLGPSALSNAFGTVSRTVGGGGVSIRSPCASLPNTTLLCGCSRQYIVE